MGILHAIIERAEHNYSAYLVEVDGIIGIGDSINEVKESLRKSIEITLEECKMDGVEIPDPLKGHHEIRWCVEEDYVIDKLRQILNGLFIDTRDKALIMEMMKE